MVFPLLGNSDHVVVSVFIEFPSNSKRDALFHGIACNCSPADWDDLRNHLRDVPWEDILSSMLLLLLVNFVSGFRLKPMYMSLIVSKYQVKSHSSPWFSVPCVTAIVHRNYFFRLYQQNKSSESEVKLRQAKEFLKLPNLHMLIKQKSLSLPRNLALRALSELLKVFSTKVNLLYLLYSLARRFCLLHLTKQSYFC